MTTETNAERLERLKVDRAEHLAEEYGTAAIATTELKFLVQQAELAQELDDELTEWQTGQNMASEHYNHLRQLNLENARLREVLEDISKNQCRHLCSTQARRALEGNRHGET